MIALAVASGFVLADDAAWCEHLAVGGVYTDPQIVSALATRSMACAQKATAERFTASLK